MWTVIDAISGEGFLLQPMPFMGALYWFIYFQNRYPNKMFDLIPIEVQ